MIAVVEERRLKLVPLMLNVFPFLQS